jgi:A/G-specific adenine glycosylase
MEGINDIQKLIKEWHETVSRPMPWKNTRDPYKIWISEIILQQTRVAQGTPYYLKFIERFPTINDLADSPLEEVLKAWQGLGYYSRARNLHTAAIYIQKECDGKFPDSYEDIRRLKGVGDYTAAAVGSFAFGLPYPVVDGNIKRVISRLYGIESSIDERETLSRINSFAESLLDLRNPGEHNQAMIDLGALVCTPVKPACSDCPLSLHCVAHAKGIESVLPIKSKKIDKKKRYLHYFVMKNNEGKIVLKQRNDKDIWASLFDLPMIESERAKRFTKIDFREIAIDHQADQEVAGSILKPKLIHTSRHLLTHRELHINFYQIDYPRFNIDLNPPFYFVDTKKVANFALPKPLELFFNEYCLSF